MKVVTSLEVEEECSEQGVGREKGVRREGGMLETSADWKSGSEGGQRESSCLEGPPGSTFCC